MNKFFDSTQSSNRQLTSKAVTYKTLGGYEVIDSWNVRFGRPRPVRSVSR
jgi:hypothetical protein